MLFWVLVFAIVLLVMRSRLRALTDRVEHLESAAQGDTPLKLLAARIAKLEARIRELEGAPLDTPPTQAAPTPVVARPVVSAPVAPAAAAPPVVPAVPAPTPQPTVPASALPVPPAPTPAVAPVRPAPTPPSATVTASAVSATSPASPTSQASNDTWEVVVGASWLNKIGVLVFVIGVALLVGYSFTHVGALGRVAIGFALSAAMLISGVVVERHATYRTYAYGLIAGGWAGIYFTTFAMHAIPAARLIDSDLIGVAALLAVSAGMIAHSLRYRSETVTALAYVVAYATLAMTPLTRFSLIASVPLAISLLAVASRFSWRQVAVLGVVSTYGLFVLRVAIAPGAGDDSIGSLRLVTLAVYWVVFELADLLSIRSATAGGRTLGLFPLNAIGMIGTASLQLPVDHARTMALFTAWASASYLVSAFLRARLGATAPDAPSTDRWSTMHAAIALAAGFALWSIELRFTGRSATLAVLTEAELLIVAGIALGERPIRTIGGLVLVAAFLHAGGDLLLTAVWRGPAAGLAAATPVAVLTALACYVNREVLRTRAVPIGWLERSYTWLAFALVMGAVTYEVDGPFRSLAFMGFALALIEAGVRGRGEYLAQANAAGLIAALAMFARFFIGAGDPLDRLWAPDVPSAVIVLSALTAGFALATYRLGRWSIDGDASGSSAAAVVAGGSAIVAFTLLIWHALPPMMVAPAWAALACGAVVLGAERQQSAARWIAYVLVTFAALRALVPLVAAPPVSWADTVAMAAVIAALYTIAYVGRRGAPADPAAAGGEPLVTAALSGAATVAFAVFKWRVLPPLAVAPAWALTAAVLVALGFTRQRTGQRWQGYVLAGVAATSALGTLLDAAPARLLDLWSPVAVTGLLYLTSAFSRDRLRQSGAGESLEPLALGLVTVAATAVLAAAEWRAVDPDVLGVAWAITAGVLTLVGLARRAPELRWQGYALILLAAFVTSGLILDSASASPAVLVSTATVLVLMYATSLLVRSATRRPGSQAVEPLEDTVRIAISVTATVVFALTILEEARPTMVTLGWGLQGLVLMVAGFAARERVLRLSGLGVLLLCILKLFLSDLRDLDPLPRIISFVVLGLVLLAVSWTYTRFQEQIRRFL